MKKKMGICCVVMVFSLAISFGCLSGCGANKRIQATAPKEGELVNLANSEVAEYIENYGIGMDSSAPYYGQGDHYAMQGVCLSWTDRKPSKRYELTISRNSDMSPAETCVVDGKETVLTDLFVNTTYYWQVSGGSGVSEIFSFRTADTPRTITIDGVSNTRDIGGKTTSEGKKIRQGMAYRGAALDDITEEGKETFLDVYQIKTDLDLRNRGEGFQGNSPVGKDVNYFNYSCPYYASAGTGATTGIDMTENYEKLASALRVFADEDNYPVYFHCAIGRDRTAMVSMLLLGVCGVSKKDICADYEMSFFSQSGCSDEAEVGSMVKNFNVTLNYIMQNGDNHGTLKDNCETYLLQIGLTQDEIDAIRQNLIEE